MYVPASLVICASTILGVGGLGNCVLNKLWIIFPNENSERDNYLLQYIPISLLLYIFATTI